MARRLLLTYLTITALALAVVMVPLGGIFADRERERLVLNIERDAQAVASLAEDALEAGRPPAIDAVLADYATGGGRIVVVDTAGLSVADSEVSAPPPRDFSTRPEIAVALDGARSIGERPSETLGTELMYVAVPVTSSGIVHGAVRVTYPTSTLDERVRTTWLRLGALAAMVLAVVAVVGVVLARQVSKPVRRLEVAARALSAGDLSVTVPADDGPPELQELARTFNAMGQRLGQLIDAHRRFVADASHQLRTPLTALRLRLETLAATARPKDRTQLEAALEETTRLGRLVQSLLVLARSDAAVPERVAVDLVAAVRERAEAWGPVAAEQDVTVALDLPERAVAWLVDGGIEQILDNLVSNALDVAPAGSTLALGVAVGDAHVELHVVDRGPGLDPAVRDHAFERFWRAPGAGPEGFGLGLAIVQQLAEASGGAASLDAGPGGVGLDVRIRLEAAGTGEDPPDAASTADLYPTLTLR